MMKKWYTVYKLSTVRRIATPRIIFYFTGRYIGKNKDKPLTMRIWITFGK